MACGERAIWHRRFWEHGVRDETDNARHLDHLHFNPVKHGHVAAVRDWPYSTFERLVSRSFFPPDWGSDQG